MRSVHGLVLLGAIAAALAIGGCGDSTSAPQGGTTSNASTASAAARAERRRERARAKARARKRAKARARRRAKARARRRALRAAAAERAAEREREREARAEREAREREQEQQAGSDCEPGYDPCVPRYPPDLDCADLDGPYSVTGSDPHGLDADNDGEGCE